MVENIRTVLYATMALEISEFLYFKITKQNPRLMDGYCIYKKLVPLIGELKEFNNGMLDQKMSKLHNKMVQSKFNTPKLNSNHEIFSPFHRHKTERRPMRQN